MRGTGDDEEGGEPRCAQDAPSGRSSDGKARAIERKVVNTEVDEGGRNRAVGWPQRAPIQCAPGSPYFADLFNNKYLHMQAIFLASLLLGLLLGVFAMLHGVERPDAAGAAGPLAPEPQASLKLPLMAAFATLFGLSGYLFTRYAALPTAADVLVAVGLGVLGCVGVATLVVKWAIPSAKEEVIDERYLLQGAPARVVRAIGPDAAGAIEYDSEGGRMTSDARSFDGSPIEAGTEVVIERVEQGIAYVERWALVEARL